MTSELRPLSLSARLYAASLVVLTSCERLAAPACPADAAGIDLSRPADPATTAAYFGSAAAGAWDDYVLQWAAGDLVVYGERPLPTLTKKSNEEVYRILTTGTFGEFSIVQTVSGRHRVRRSNRRLCEDQDVGIATHRWTGTLRQANWSELSACMQREFWERGTPDDDPRWPGVHRLVAACGPGRQEVSCVRAEVGFTVVEGLRRGEHLVRTFIDWQPEGRHAGLARCMASMRSATFIASPAQ